MWSEGVKCMHVTPLEDQCDCHICEDEGRGLTSRMLHAALHGAWCSVHRAVPNHDPGQLQYLHIHAACKVM